MLHAHPNESARARSSTTLGVLSSRTYPWVSLCIHCASIAAATLNSARRVTELTPTALSPRVWVHIAQYRDKSQQLDTTAGHQRDGMSSAHAGDAPSSIHATKHSRLETRLSVSSCEPEVPVRVELRKSSTWSPTCAWFTWERRRRCWE